MFGGAADAANRVFTGIGRAIESILGRGLDIGATRDRDSAATRIIEERVPVASGGVVSLDHGFGSVHVRSWDQQVTQYRVEVSVAAESREAAARIAESVRVEHTARRDSLRVRTVLPDLGAEESPPVLSVDIELTVPRDATLTLRQLFGDVEIGGLGGRVAVDAAYGAVTLRDIAGPVELRARGDQPVTISGLARGGVFRLDGVAATFDGIDGETRISSFGGALEVEALGVEAALDVFAEGGPVRIAFGADADPDLAATVRFGELVSDWPETIPVGDLTMLRHERPEARQRATVDAVFGDVAIVRGSARATAEETTPGTGEGMSVFRETTTRTEPISPDMRLVIEANAGGVRIEGVDAPELTITEERTVWAAAAVAAPRALEDLRVSVGRDGPELIVTSLAPDPAAFPALRRRTDLFVQCPRTLPLRVTARDGVSAVSSMAASMEVRQQAGRIEIADVTGDILIENAKGGVSVLRCSGAVEVAVAGGDVVLRENTGIAAVTCSDGRVLVDGPGGALSARVTNGEVRILALDGLRGDLEAVAEGGNISLALPESPDADLSVAAIGGVVQSAIPLTGSVSKDRQEFHVLLKEGRHRVRLEARNGDVRID